MYYKKALAGVVVFDVTNMETLKGAEKWKYDIDSKVFLSDGKPIPVILMANKCDLVKTDALDRKMLEAFCKTHGFIGW